MEPLILQWHAYKMYAVCGIAKFSVGKASAFLYRNWPCFFPVDIIHIYTYNIVVMYNFFIPFTQASTYTSLITDCTFIKQRLCVYVTL